MDLKKEFNNQINVLKRKIFEDITDFEKQTGCKVKGIISNDDYGVFTFKIKTNIEGSA